MCVTACRQAYGLGRLWRVPADGAGGNLVAQGWNALLAGIGVREYNAKAKARPLPTVYAPPNGVRTEYEKKAAGVIEVRRARTGR